MERVEVPEANAGDIVALTGPEGVSIGDTISSIEHPEALPSIDIEEPTVRMTFGVSTSPFMGKEGEHWESESDPNEKSSGPGAGRGEAEGCPPAIGAEFPPREGWPRTHGPSIHGPIW